MFIILITMSDPEAIKILKYFNVDEKECILIEKAPCTLLWNTDVNGYIYAFSVFLCFHSDLNTTSKNTKATRLQLSYNDILLPEYFNDRQIILTKYNGT